MNCENTKQTRKTHTNTSTTFDFGSVWSFCICLPSSSQQNQLTCLRLTSANDQGMKISISRSSEKPQTSRRHWRSKLEPSGKRIPNDSKRTVVNTLNDLITFQQAARMRADIQNNYKLLTIVQPLWPLPWPLRLSES